MIYQHLQKTVLVGAKNGICTLKGRGCAPKSVVAYICFSEIYILNITERKIENPASYPAGLVGDCSAGSGVSKGFGFISGFYEGSDPDLVWRSGPNIPNSQDPICFDLAPDPNLEK